MVNIPIRHKFLLKQLIKAQEIYFPNKAIKALDIGASNGSFITLASKRICNLERIDGVETDSTYADYISSMGHLFIQDLQIDTGNIPLHTYNIITMWEIIEHIENIYVFLRNVKNLLAKDSIITIATPNTMSFSRLFKGNNWIGTRDRSHRILYDKLTLKMLLENSGYSILKICNYFFPNRLPEAFSVLNNITSPFPGGGMLFAIAKIKQ